ncbi:shikimate dehydrogenase family protein [Falsigemmobacter faecalis]|uniref:shikimate dehydrogenase (NADP(+)) n=1 Tax=Falsigemmobacter faecalis TaxID=2488730 RepID=A0A3P3DPE7_9RHOB|nr:shikimate dehydrogenase [Falsigemmobacter faecalis]RRH76137.1 shikimate dehydrogenase [Falsigemmobacter faecalis]
MKITGKTRIMFILADPVAHVIGTDVLNQAFAARGLDLACSPLHVPPEGLASVLQGLRQIRNLAGFGCTIPHKAAVLPLLDQLTEEARAIGAVNFVRRESDGSLTGTNVDGAGFMAGLKAQGVEVTGRRALLLGAGGVGRPIAFSLALAGLSELVIANRDLTRAEDLAEGVRALVPGCRTRACESREMPPPEGFDLVINATSLGMKPDDALPFDPRRLQPQSVVAEVIMTPAVTPVMAMAAARGCLCVPGLAMMRPQAGLVAEFLGL